MILIKHKNLITWNIGESNYTKTVKAKYYFMELLRGLQI